MEKKEANLKRRGFLLSLGAGSAGVAAVAVTAATGGQPVVEKAVEVAKGESYAASEHVRNYYRTTRI